MLRSVGLCILLFTIYLVLRGRRRALCSSLLRYEWMSSLLGFAVRELECFMRPISDILAEYDRRPPVSCGELAGDLLDEKKRVGILSGYDADAARLLSEYFGTVGSSYIDGELAMLSHVRGEFSEMLTKKRKSVEEGTRLSGVLGGAGAVALFILLV